jgi:hypothetical protein
MNNEWFVELKDKLNNTNWNDNVLCWLPHKTYHFFEILYMDSCMITEEGDDLVGVFNGINYEIHFNDDGEVKKINGNQFKSDKIEFMLSRFYTIIVPKEELEYIERKISLFKLSGEQNE